MARKTRSYIQQGSSTKKDAHYATLAFACGVFVWVPLLNLVLVPLGIIFGIMGMRLARTHPATHGGMARAITGVTICAAFIVVLVLGIAFDPDSGAFMRQMFTR